MNNIDKVMKIVQENALPFYIEHNDFLKVDICVNQEVADLIRDNEIDPIDAGECLRLNSVWSARFYFNNGENFKIAYASTFDKVINQILEILENHNENAF